MSFVVIARYRAQPGAEGRVAESLRNMLTPTRAEPGNLRYDVYRDPEYPGVFVLCEEYRDRAAFEAHLASEHFQRHLADGTLPHLAERRREDLVPLDG